MGKTNNLECGRSNETDFRSRAQSSDLTFSATLEDLTTTPSRGLIQRKPVHANFTSTISQPKQE